MWLAGGQKPAFRSINIFRSEKLKDAIQKVFMTAANLLEAEGYIEPENCFVDATKIGSAAGK